MGLFPGLDREGVHPKTGAQPGRGGGRSRAGVPGVLHGSVYLENLRHRTTNDCQETWTCGSAGGRRQSGSPGGNCCRAYVFLVLAGLSLAARSPPKVLGVRATHPLFPTLLGAISPPRHRAVLARLPRGTKPRCERALGAEARQGRALSPLRPPHSQAAGASGRSAARRQPRGVWDGGGRGGGRPLGLEPTAHFKKLWGCASAPRPGNFKAAGAVPAA